MVTRTTLTEGASESGPPGGDGLHVLVISPEMFFSVALPDSGEVSIGRSTSGQIVLDDPVASRRHVRLHLGSQLEVEDLGSANGTRVGDVSLPPHQRVPLALGQPIGIGSTVLLVQEGPWWPGPRRAWSHVQFEDRVTGACVEAQEAGREFVFMRLRAEQSVPWSQIFPILTRTLRPPDLFAVYGRNEFEALVLSEHGEQVTEQVKTELQQSGLNARIAVARFPRDGRSTDALLARANLLLRDGSSQATLPGYARSSDEMLRLNAVVERAARSSINVLILGETGVGKEVLARAVHRLSGRAHKPLVSLNCAGLSETLIESELFGYEKGAFTGATHTRVGLLESADGGTVFLDEIGEMTPRVQAVVLRAIETREVLPVGSRRARPIDVRFIAATNRDLEADIERGTFRRDLFFRLNGFTLSIPPLRERRAEIPELAKVFLTNASRDARADIMGIDPGAMALLEGYQWPGNVRELKNVIERAVVLCEGNTILPSHLPLERLTERRSVLAERQALYAAGQVNSAAPASPQAPSPSKAGERQRILDALQECAGNQSRAAKLLGMSRRTLVTKLDLYGVPRPQKLGRPDAANTSDDRDD